MRRWAQLSIIFGLTDQTLEYLLSSNGNTFNEDSLRGLLLVTLKDNAANVSLALVRMALESNIYILERFDKKPCQVDFCSISQDNSKILKPAKILEQSF